MRPFVVRLDPTPFDPAPGDDELPRLKQTWNAWNGRARKLLDQESRIENLYWRRWHMEQRHGPVQSAVRDDLYGLHASVEAHERRRATEDLEAFLRTTLQAAQPSTHVPVPPQPPTFAALTQSALPTSLSQPSPPAGQPAPTPPLVSAPQPQRLAFNPSPEWGYSPLPSISQPNQSRIIATPAWTALISDSPRAAQAQPPSQSAPQQAAEQQLGAPLASSSSSSATAQHQQLPTLQHPQPMAALNAFGFPGYPFPGSGPSDPFAASTSSATVSHGVFPFGMPPSSAAPPALPSPSFALPPTATVFSDLPSALSSAPPTAAPPAFFSSYGMYQPVIAPYPRFLTPSPEPSILGELELELGPTTGEFHSSSSAGVTPTAGADGMDHVWRDLEGRSETSPGDATVPPVSVSEGRDPFEGMSLAQMRSRANSLEAVDRDASRFDIGGATGAAGGGGDGSADPDAHLSLAEQAAREVERAAQLHTDGGAAYPSATAKGKRKAKGGGGGGKKTKGSRANSPDLDGGDASSSKLANGSKKNRNPHSTQLPGNGQRRAVKEEAGEGHEGPVCSHCGSITTPLWRRGPHDELLCNACGLYLKLHSKPRPKTFGKSNASKRTSNGAAAQAAASGVPPSCNNCGATSTPMWRKDPEGRLCCNACSLYYKLHKVNRPASLAQKRQAAAAAKANLAAAAAAGQNGEASASTSPSGLVAAPPAVVSNAQLPTPATSSEVTPVSSNEAHAPIPPPPPHLPHAFHPPFPPPGMPMNPGDPTAMHFMPQPPMWPPHPLAPNLYGPVPPMHHHLAPHQQHPATAHKYMLPPAMPQQGMPPNPFAQTAWGALAYGIVSAAAAEEAGTGPPGSAPPPPLPPS
ncbi:hypothetical protein JCM8208_000391 [Rhodotorula glutinis]